VLKNSDSVTTSSWSNAKCTAGFLVVLLLTAIMTSICWYYERGWKSQSELTVIADRLKTLPERFGEWSRVDQEPLAPSAEKLLQCHGYINHTYANSSTGAIVKCAVLFGPRGPIAVHTPEVCYGGQGLTAIGKRSIQSVQNGERKDQFWRVEFSVKNSPDVPMEVWYAWTDNGPWIASENPRFWLTDSLYKIQIATSSSNASTECADFLESFLPALRERIHS
jgi:hypothetical protein